MQCQQPGTSTELRHHEDSARSGAGDEEYMQDVHEQWLAIAEDFLEASKVLAACLEERDECLEQEDGQETDITRMLFQLVREIFFKKLRPAYACLEFLDALDERVVDTALEEESQAHLQVNIDESP